MTGEIVSVGTELLLGQIVNTNARDLAEVLARYGIDVYFQQVVGDNLERLTAALRLALGRSDLVLTTGGLGPTQDDLTRDGVAAALGLDLVENEEARQQVEAFFARRRRALTATQYRQWVLPRGARPIANSVGSAPGFWLEGGGKLVVALPGPPPELRAMVRSFLEPFLRERSGGQVLFSRTLRVCELGEAVAEERVRDIVAHATNPTIAPYAKPGEVHFRLTAKAPDEATARALIAPVEAALRERLDPYVFGVDDEELEAVVGRLLRERGLTLAAAESCTGGLLGQRLTSVAGSSDYFLLSAVTYSNAAKTAVLGVPAETLAQHGAVSAETARAMAEGVR
ncbi:MAG: competence/damage-inducible protein A, partial [Clostridia bacterium]|nr:competence/damage-inducible protein A [Clostridia bacterium]